jgi:4'-phosphopantetheinyl transferase
MSGQPAEPVVPPGRVPRWWGTDWPGPHGHLAHDRRGPAHPGPGAPARAGPPPGADVWHIPLDADRDVVRVAARLLDPHELRRAGSFRDTVAAHRYTVAHGAARTILGGYLGVPGDAVRWSVGPHGKPVFDGALSRWQWSLSRSGGHALLAVCVTAPVGVDLEGVEDSGLTMALATRFLPDEESAHVSAQPGPDGPQVAYHRLLSRKEACVKASGGRLLDGLGLAVLAAGDVPGTGRYAGQSWRLCDLPVPPRFVAALATLGGEVRQIRLFTWDWSPRGPAAGSCSRAARATAAFPPPTPVRSERQRSADPRPREECRP